MVYVPLDKSAPAPSADERFPAGRWVTVKNEWLPGGQIEIAADGWLRATAHGFVHIDGFAAHNAGLRGRFRGNPPVISRNLPELTLREAVFGDLSSGFQLSVVEEKSGIALKVDRLSGAGRTKVNLAQKTLPQNLPPESEATVELYVIGRSIVVRCAGQTLVTTPDQEAADLGMSAAIYGLNRDQFRDLEVMNLDGLPEAEALKAAGIDGEAAPTGPSAPVSVVPVRAGGD